MNAPKRKACCELITLMVFSLNICSLKLEAMVAILERRSIMVVVMEAMMMVMMITLMTLMREMRETRVDFFGDGLYFKRLGCIQDKNVDSYDV